MHAAAGILTARGGMTSHAAVVARGMGRPCVSGAGTLRIDAKAGTMTVGGNHVFKREMSSPSTDRPARCWKAKSRCGSRNSQATSAKIMGVG
jgi:phosphoenolpyruvate-protein kinase (PTS system EI component)